ncbi:hypothetical protein ACFVZD_39370 [Streptomyces sp. NPDC058287]|uniref:plasmid mobilization protein n=1 Tax=unclassified Streptomyces TaxID=2593676 RepID=UPI0036F00251
MASKKQINVRVDPDVYEGIEQRAAAVGMEVNEYARQVLADEANDLRHRFLDAGAHFAGQWGPHFAEEFGQGTSPRGQAA